MRMARQPRIFPALSACSADFDSVLSVDPPCPRCEPPTPCPPSPLRPPCAGFTRLYTCGFRLQCFFVLMSSQFGVLFRVATWGESHGGGVGATVDGCPARIPLVSEDIQAELDRRRPGQSE